MIDLNARLYIERLGARGEGIARRPNDSALAGVDAEPRRGLVFVPYALAGETVLAETDGERGKLIDILTPSPDRIPPICQYYGICGGCAVQTLAKPAYLDWKRSLLADALANAHIEAPIAPTIDAHGAGRRRVTFHARQRSHHSEDIAQRGRIDVGFMRARSHDIVDIESCPLLAPGLAGEHSAVAAARAIAKILAPLGKPLDLLATATSAGIDLDIRGCGPLDFAFMQKLIACAAAYDLARISNHGEIVIERRAPYLKIGRSDLILPPGGFLQATEAGEAALTRLVMTAAKGAKRIADLFCGVGTFALPLAETTEVHAVETDASALAALAKAAHNTPSLKRVTIEQRDLFRRPLARDELKRFDGVVFDPPRAGAEAQAQALAASDIPLVIAVSCNAQTFARDARILIEGGYVFEQATPVDQFIYSAHIEICAVFRKTSIKRKAKRGILSR